jgi:autotransporter-associated beta strand protein
MDMPRNDRNTPSIILISQAVSNQIQRRVGEPLMTTCLPCWQLLKSLRLMKIELIILTLAVVSCAFTATVVFGQTTYTWTGAGDGTNLANAANWSPAGGPPSGVTQDTGQWNGVVPGNLTITCTQTGDFLPGTGFNGQGVNWNLTSNQAGSVTILDPVDNSQNIGFYNINVASGAGALTLGDNTSHQLNLITRPAGAVHAMVNNSANPATINPSVWWQAGGGNAYVLDFGGTGNWVINNYLRPGDGGPTTIKLEGPGNLIWNASGIRDDAPTGPIIINGGSMILKSPNLVPFEFPTTVPAGNNTIVNNGTMLEFDAAAQSDTIARAISGTGPLQVNNGTWTFSGQNTFTGNISLTGGEMIAGTAENAGTSGPLGVGGTISFTGGMLGFSANNAFDYSSRFNTAAGQAISIDTSGQDVTFTNALGSSGGTLAKVGPGTLTLSGTCAYSGNTTINGGELVFKGTKTRSGNISLADNAALGITASMQVGTLALGTASGATLEFFGVKSTTAAPLVAGTLSSVGTVTININNGTFTVGQSYPLLSCPSGSVPAVSLGNVGGALGFLSTNGNTIQFNVISISKSSLNFTQTVNSLQFSWDTSLGTYRLQAQTNSLSVGVSNNWADYPGGGTSPVTVPIDAMNESVFFRLVSP